MMATTPGWADHAAPRGPSAQATLLPAPVTGSAYKGEPQRDGGHWQTNEPRNGDGRARSVACPGGVEGQSRSRSGCLKDSNSKPPPPSSVLCVRQLEEAMHALPYQKWC